MFFNKKNRKDQILSKKSITVDDLSYLIDNHPETIATYDQSTSQRLLNAKKWFDEEPINVYKRKVMNLKKGDKILNAVKSKWVVHEITPYEIIFHSADTGEFVSRFTKWDFYKTLKMNIPITFL